MDISKKIKELRESKKMSVVDLAEKLSVSRAIIYGYESGERIPPTSKIKALAAVFGVPVSELLEPTQKQESVSPAWLQGLVDEYREKERRYLDQIEKLTNMLAANLGKFEVSANGLNSAQMEISFSNRAGFMPETEKRKIAA